MPVAVPPAVAAIGTALQVAGVGFSAYSAVKQQSAQKQMIEQERRQEEERRRAMELDARRRQLETIRQQQRARALALTSATAQGAGQGSGLQGGYGQISGQTTTNLLGVDQNLEIGRNIFNSNSIISGARMNMADAQSYGSMGSGMMSLGGTLTQNMGTIGNLTQGFGGGSQPSYTSFGTGQGAWPMYR